MSVEDWAEIRRLHRAEGLPIRMIARMLGVSRNTVRAAIGRDDAPKYERAPAGSIVDEVEPRVRELLRAFPTMPATVIAERIGWTRGLTVLKVRMAEMRPAYLPPDPASRTAYVAGEIAQNDFWFPDIVVPVGFGQTRTAKQLPVLTMVAAYSRTLFARLIPFRTAADLYCGWWVHLQRLGGVPRALVWDGEGAVGGCGGGRNKLTAECQAFRGTLGAKVVILRPRDPEAKGIIDRAHDYLEAFVGATGDGQRPPIPRVGRYGAAICTATYGSRWRGPAGMTLPLAENTGLDSRLRFGRKARGAC